MDRYTKIILTLIAVGIWGNLLTNLADNGHGFIGVANAQGAPTKVVIVGVQASPNDSPLSVVDVWAKQTAMAAASAARSTPPTGYPPGGH